ncbi:MAG: DNA translocase FtsK [Betaproteobacteria bacterium]|nr:DNA translocase FtsK [Betaproteobacteria bacterium]
MSISEADALVGEIALEFVLAKLKAQKDDDPHFRGAFHVLSGFSVEQLVGFVRAKDASGPRANDLKIQFPESELLGFGVDPQYLTKDSSVSVRNRGRDGSITLTAEIESDAEASLADSDRTDASDLKGKSIAPVWIDVVQRRLGLMLVPEERRKVEALLRGLFDTGRCPTSKVGDYLFDVLTRYEGGEVLARAAGKALPVIGLPLFEDCFVSLNESKMAQPSQWAAKFKAHYSLECYLDKRGLSQEPLDSDRLRERLLLLRSDDYQPPIPEPLLAAFQSYIESENARNSATEDLLLKHDWAHTTHCFDRTRKTSSKDFAKRTKQALEDEGIALTQDDRLVIESLSKIARQSGKASEEFIEFFDRRAEALEKDKPLYVEWEDFVHGKKIECTDLLQGIFECIQRSIRALSPLDEAIIELEGRQQKTVNNFLEMNKRACEYFERAYGDLERRTKKRIRFRQTLVFEYTSNVLPRLKEKPKYKPAESRSVKANSLSFLVSVFKTDKRGVESKLATLTLAWRFPLDSVLAQEVVDLDAICRYFAKRKTALVECIAQYEVVGRKGLPTPLSLECADGFADVARGGGRGAFVPAQDRIVPLAAVWKEVLDKAISGHWLSSDEVAELKKCFDDFGEKYGAAVVDLRKSMLAVEGVSAVAESYRALLLAINLLKHQDARRQLLRVVLRVGLAQVQRSGRRPPMAVICPWHPLRMEAAGARLLQVLGLIDRLLGTNRPPFSDGASGSLFFREVEQLLEHPLYPEVAVVWEGTQPYPRVVSQAFGAYTLHQPAELFDESSLPALDDESKASAATIEHEMKEYLRLQPHERDNFSVLLYNCDSPSLPMAVVESINRINAEREDDKITCQVLLMHRDEDHLRQIYRDLVARGVDAEEDSTEASGDFLAKVRVNITAANRLKRLGRSQPVDIAYCRDQISREAKPVWEWLPRETLAPHQLQPHQWSRRLPVSTGDRMVRLQLACPAQTETGWAYLYSLAFLCANGADDAWAVSKCPVLMRRLDFDEQSVERIFRETHELATWVINQDELLDRKLLEARNIKVIRYVQSATHGRNLIISSDARETLLFNTLIEKLKVILASDTPPESIDHLCKRIIGDANSLSGGLVLRAARRANYTNELLGAVLSRYLVLTELGEDRAIAWCFLDDYSQWLGKKEGASIADLLILAPKVQSDGALHLDIVVTEAKFVAHDLLGKSSADSAKQLTDTLSQLTEAMGAEEPTIDQEIWLARLSDLLVSQTVVPAGHPPLDMGSWRRALRQRQCSVSIWGYSHVFVYRADDMTAQMSTTKGVPAPKGQRAFDALQEIFGPGFVRELIIQYGNWRIGETTDLRLRNGHPPFGRSKLFDLSTQTDLAKSPGESMAFTEDRSLTLDGEIDTVGRSAVTPAVEVSPLGNVEIPPLSPAINGSASTLIDYLKLQSSKFESTEEQGKEWLDSTTTHLRQALISRGLPAKLVEGMGPILTPNAGIIKLQGSKELTVQAVEARADEIYTSEGLKIISVTPESGRVSISIERPNRQVLHTEPVLLKYLEDYSHGNLGEKLFVGIREEDGRPLLLDPFNQPHTLIAGITGSGKSVLMQNLILSIAATRSPEEAHIYLIDPKFGVDYRPLDELPHVELGSGGIVDDPVEAIAILESLVVEMNRRYELFKQCKVANVHAYRRTTGKPLPTLWVVHDEFADWMQTDSYRQAVPDIVGRLSVKARAAGIFLLFAAQRPDKDVMPMQLRSQLGNRLILKVDNAATAEISMGSKGSGAERLLGRGHMLAKTGDMPDAVFTQVPFIDMEQAIPILVRLIRQQYGIPVEPVH